MLSSTGEPRTHQGSRQSPITRALVVPVACSIVGLLLLLPKPIHIDDVFYLRVAEQILSEPSRPYSFVLNWWGEPEPAYAQALSPPFFSYWLAATLALFGRNLVALHVSTWLFLVMSALAVRSLATRFTSHPNAVTAIVMLSPAVLPSCNLMLDIPALGLGLGALALHVYGEDNNHRPAKAIAVLLAAAALMTKYLAGTVCLLMAAYSLLRRRPAALVWQLVPLTVCLAWVLVSFRIYGVPQVAASHAADMSISPAEIKAYLAALGASAMVLPLSLAGCWQARPRAVARSLGAVLILIAGGRALRLHQAEFEAFLFFSNALLWLLLIGWPLGKTGDRAGDTPDRVFLVSWAAAPPLLAMLVAPFPALRHLLLSLPALVMLAVRRVRPADGSVRLRLGLCVCLTAAVGVLVALADIQYAHTYVVAARRCASLGPPGHVWYLGHWGWQYYADQAGLQQLSISRTSLPSGDLVVIPREPDVQPPSPLLAARLKQSAVFEIPGSLPVRTMNQEAKAGFYASPWPFLPYTFSRAPLDRFEIRRFRDGALAPSRAGLPSPRSAVAHSLQLAELGVLHVAVEPGQHRPARPRHPVEKSPLQEIPAAEPGHQR